MFLLIRNTFVPEFNFEWYREELSLVLLLSRAEEASLVKIRTVKHDFYYYFFFCSFDSGATLEPVLLFPFLQAFPRCKHLVLRVCSTSRLPLVLGKEAGVPLEKILVSG